MGRRARVAESLGSGQMLDEAGAVRRSLDRSWLSIAFALAGPDTFGQSSRRLAQDPVRLLEPFVRAGMTVLDPGPGMAVCTARTRPACRAKGRVVAVDVQQKMIAGLRRRAERAGAIDRIETRVTPAASDGAGWV